MGKRRYTDDERAGALAALAVNSGNVNRTARQVGVPRRTLAQWAKGQRHPEAAQMSQLKKRPLAEALQDLAYQLIDMPASTIAKASVKDRAIATGVLIDKAQLLLSQPPPSPVNFGVQVNVNGHAARDQNDAESDDTLLAIRRELIEQGTPGLGDGPALRQPPASDRERALLAIRRQLIEQGAPPAGNGNPMPSNGNEARARADADPIQLD
jgi:transposase-like protein